MGAERRSRCGRGLHPVGLIASALLLVFLPFFLTGCGTPAATNGSAGSTAVPIVDAGAPSKLEGLDRAQIRALLGSPELRRVEPPAELWQYRAADCVLDLFFYPTPDGYRVTDVTRRWHGLSKVDAGQCDDGSLKLPQT